MKALGMIEIKGFSSSIEALDACLKAADVSLVNYEANFGSVIIKIEGDVGAVYSSVDAGKEVALKYGTLISSHVIAQPDGQVDGIVTGEKYLGDKYFPVSGKIDKTEDKVKAEVIEEPEIEPVKKSSISDIIRESRETVDKEKETVSLEEIIPEEVIVPEEETIHEEEIVPVLSQEFEESESINIDELEFEDSEEDVNAKSDPVSETVIEDATENNIEEVHEPVEIPDSGREVIEKKKEKSRDCNYICALCDDLDCPDRRE